MAISGNPDVDQSIEDSLEEVKQQVDNDNVNVDSMRDPDELIEQVDRLEELVKGLRKRQRQIAEAHSEDIHELEFGEAVDNSALESEIEEARDEGVDLSRVEERLDSLEIAVDTVEASFDENIEKLKEKIIEEASEIDEQQLERIEEDIQKLDDRIEDARLEEQKDNKEIDERVSGLEERIKEINELEEQIQSLEIGEDIIESEIEGDHENLRELIVEEVIGGFERRMQDIEAEINELREKINFEKVDNLIDRQELEERIGRVEEERQQKEDRLEEKIVFLRERLADSELEEKVDASRLEQELEELEERLQEDVASEKTVSSVEKRIDLISERVEQTENKISGLAERDEEVVNDINQRLTEVEKEVSETGSGEVSREEFDEMKEKMEEMSDLLLKVARKTH